MKILLVGLSNKIGLLPFDESTNSGKVINEIIKQVDCEFVKMNLVPYAPLDHNGKLRYPTKKEIEMEIPKFLKEVEKLDPDLIITFGNIVTSYLSKIDLIKNKIISFKHPSYIYVYKRKQLDEYIDSIVNTILEYENNFKK